MQIEIGKNLADAIVSIGVVLLVKAHIFDCSCQFHGEDNNGNCDAYTNGMESFWAIFKRGYTGTYHHMSKKHLQRYVNEFAYRWNTRMVEMSDLFAGVVQNVAGQNTLSYKSLTA